VLQIGAEGFVVGGMIASDGGVEYRVESSYERASGARRTSVAGADVPRRTDLIGQFPVVLLSPEQAAITVGGPADRRKFLDLTLSQAGRLYLEDLLEYRKALRQRNKALLDAKLTRRPLESSLDAWSELLVRKGTRVALRRREFVEEFRPYVERAFERIAGGQEQPTLTYDSRILAGPGGSEAEVTEAFRRALDESSREEAKAGTTLVGPHRDEMELQINGLPVREFASQGQHKTFLVGLKLAEFSYLKDQCSETPLLLLDDVFSELDEQRCRHLLDLVATAGQVFITATDERAIPAGIPNGPRKARFHVRGGRVERKLRRSVRRSRAWCASWGSRQSCANTMPCSFGKKPLVHTSPRWQRRTRSNMEYSRCAFRTQRGGTN
jgi:DNA replication and repair protein RecF